MITKDDADKAIAYVKAGLAEFEGKIVGVEAKPWMVKSEKLTLKCLEFAKKWAGAEEIEIDKAGDGLTPQLTKDGCNCPCECDNEGIPFLCKESEKKGCPTKILIKRGG